MGPFLRNVISNTLICILFPLFLYSQGEFNNWYFETQTLSTDSGFQLIAELTPRLWDLYRDIAANATEAPLLSKNEISQLIHEFKLLESSFLVRGKNDLEEFEEFCKYLVINLNSLTKSNRPQLCNATIHASLILWFHFQSK